MILNAAERVLVHLHRYWNTKEPGRESTQAGIAEGAHLLRSHVPRALRPLLADGLVEEREAHMRGMARKITAYALTPAGVSRAREILDDVDALPVNVDGRTTSLGEARRTLGLSAVEAVSAMKEDGTLRSTAPPSEERGLLCREEDLAVLRRWRAGPAAVAVVYGAHGMGKTALGRAFARSIANTAWVDVGALAGLREFAFALEKATGAATAPPDETASVAAALREAFARGTKLLVLDGYGEPSEEIVEVLAAFLRLPDLPPRAKLLVLAQETTPAFCRFYGHRDVTAGTVVERHLKGLDLEATKTMLGNPGIGDEDLRRIYLLTKGCPLYLQFIREGDEYGLRRNSRFTNAEIRLLLYSRGTPA